jgi:copper chaperone
VEQVTLVAPDISCGHCVATVQSAVGGIAGVESVKADEATKYVTVVYDPKLVELNQITQVMEEEGYPVAG